jgi:hypothetical protein
MADFTLRFDVANIEKLTRGAAALGLTRGMAVVQAKSMDNTPVDTGNLKASQTVVPATPASLRAALVSDTPYGVYVHERMTAKHTSGAAKFMEDAVNSEAAKAFGVVAATIAERAL